MGTIYLQKEMIIRMGEQAVLRIAMVDDNGEDLQLLQGYLARYQEEKRIRMQVISYTSSLDFIEEYGTGYDVVFLDVEMPGMDGMAAAREIRQRDEAVGIIFITNMAQYAIRGYEVNAIDFMVKPVGYFNFADKFGKAIHFAEKRTEREILLSGEDGIVRLSVSDLRYIEKEKNYLIYHTGKGDFRTRGTMQETKEKLGRSCFSECTTGCLVNLQYVERMGRNTVLIDQTELPVSRRLKKEFTQDFIDYVGGVF